MAVAAAGLVPLAQGSWNNHMWGWGGWWMGLGMALFWVALIWLVVLLVRVTDRDRRSEPPAPPDRAHEVLAERFARGELDSDEYRARLDILQRS